MLTNTVFLVVVVFVIAIAISSWVAQDARKHKIPTSGVRYDGNTGALAWFLACLFLWIIVAPAYLIRRRAVLGARERKPSQPSSENRALQELETSSGVKNGNDQQFIYEFTMDDFLAFHDHILFVEYRRNFYLRSLTTGLFVAVMAGVGIYLASHSITGTVIGAALTGAIFGFGNRLFERDRFERALVKLYKDAPETTFGEFVLATSAEGVRVSGLNSASVLSWDAFFKIRFTDEYCFAFLGPIQAFIIRRQSLGKRATEFQRALQENIEAERITGAWEMA